MLTAVAFEPPESIVIDAGSNPTCRPLEAPETDAERLIESEKPFWLVSAIGRVAFVP